MECRARFAVASLLAGALISFPADASAQATYTLIHKFHAGAFAPLGRLAEAPDGALYGTTYCGGEPGSGCSGGTLFVLRPLPDGTWSFETLHTFRPSPEGGNPAGGLTLTGDGSFYGIATRRGRPVGGGQISTGTIFRFVPTGSFSVVHVFPDNSPGEDPAGRLFEATDGSLYGATCRSGVGGPTSTLFRLTPAGSFASIYTFPREDAGVLLPNGLCPMGELTERNGFLYGTTSGYGRPSPILPQLPRNGTLFRVDPRSTPTPFSVVHTFRGLDGAAPVGGLTPGSSDDFFGTTLAGGFFGQGVVYRLDASGVVRTVHTFLGLDGAQPFGRLARSTDGGFYGTTLRGGLGHGTIFRVGAGGFSSMLRFTGANGSAPVEVMQARDGHFYGATTDGGPSGGGTIYRLGPGTALSTLHEFSPGLREPADGVIQASDGDFYGTTHGSSFGAGAVYRLTASGDVTILYEFTPPSGSDVTNRWVAPSRLVEGADGMLYGTTMFGATHAHGMVYRISKTGVVTMLHAFLSASGGQLIRGLDDNIYGTIGGDSATPPSIFRIDRQGAYTTVYSFELGFSLAGPLAEGPDGALYGVAFGSGPFNTGGLFRVTKSGVLTVLYSFEPSFLPSDPGYRPVNGLIRSGDGGLYGSTSTSLTGLPSVFRFDPATSSIVAVARLWAAGPLTEGRDGAIYGWTNDPLAPDGDLLRRLFRLVDGRLELLYDTVEEDGINPSPVFQATNGALYGTMQAGFWRDTAPETWRADTFAGGVFRITVPPVAATAIK